MKSLVAAGFAAAALFALPASAAAAHPAAATGATAADGISVPTSAGSGCPNHSATIDISPDGTSFTASYDRYRAAAAPVSATRKNCQFAVSLQPPSGYTYASLQAESYGSAQLSAALTAQLSTTVYYQGAADQASRSHPIGEEGWRTADPVDLTGLGGAPACGDPATLMINTSVNLPLDSSADPATNFVTVDSAQFEFALQPCA